MRLAPWFGAVAVLAVACGKSEAPPKPKARPVATAPTSAAPALAAPAPAAAPQKAPALASCTTAAGDVEVRRAGGDAWAPLDAEDPVHVGDWVRTGTLSFARITFANGVRLDFDENAMVEFLERASNGSSAAITLKGGIVRGSFDVTGLELVPLVGDGEPAGPSIEVGGVDGSKIIVASKNGQGAAFRLTGDEEGTRVKIESGAATVEVSGESSPVAAGSQVEMAKGKRVAPSKQLDSPVSVEPSAEARLAYRQGMVIPFSWKAVSGAKDYRAQVATDLSFTRLVFSQRLDGPGFRFTPPSDGMYVWRVVARDLRGREGDVGAVRRLYVVPGATKVKDMLLRPEQNAVYEFTDTPPKISFSWNADEASSQYRWVLAEGPDLLNEPISAKVVREPRIEFDDLPAKGGEFYWGVYGERDGPVPLFNRPRRLVVKKVKKAKFETVKKITTWGN